MDELTERWLSEMHRIALKASDQVMPWEEALVQLTLELKPTMAKIQTQAPLGDYDRFLLEILRLLVLRGRDDDRELALQKLADAVQGTEPYVPN